MSTTVEPLTLRTRDGHDLAARAYVPAGEVRRAVLVGAAMGVPQRFYQAFSTWLAEQGVAVLTFDWRGTGDSAPRSLRGFRASITDWATQDLTAAADVLCTRWPNAPRTFLGHSLGGQLFGWLDRPERFERVLTVASGNGHWRMNAPAVRRKAPLLWWVLVPVGIALAGYFPGKRLGAVGDLPADVMWQWRRWCLHPDYVGSEGLALRERYAAIRHPITVVLMEDDELISPEGIRALYRLYAGAQVRFETLHPHAHGLKRLGHFGLFQPNASKLWPQVLRWLEA